MKAVRMVHPSFAREIIAEDDARRLRAQGWLELADAKAVSRGAEAQRQLRRRRRLLGFRLVTIWLPPEAFAAIQRRKPPGESLDAFVARLLCDDDQ